jgi:hypothetical protein
LGVRRRLWGVLLLALGGIAWAGVHAVAHRAADLGMPAHAGHGHGTAAQASYLSTSLTLCLSLALVLAAASGVYPRWRGGSGRSLWLFGGVPVLGLLVGAIIDSGGAHGLTGNLVELLPVVALVVAVQGAVALTAVRVARGLLDAVEGAVRALLGAASTADRAPRGVALSFGNERTPFAALVSTGRPRGPPARASAS